MKPLGMGLVGPGFIAAQHIDAVRRLGNVEIVAIAGANQASAQRRARELNVSLAYGDYTALIANPQIQVIHNTTPNHLHFEISMAALAAGKHVISDKPLAADSEQSARRWEAAAAANVAHVVTFNYRGNPLVQEMRARVAAGALGEVVFVHGCYFQDWMSDPNVYSWRLDPAKGGASSALMDIGSHWCDLAEHVVGSRISEVLADLSTVIKTRFAGRAEMAFATRDPGERVPVAVNSEDVATVLLRFANGAKGVFSVGQVLPGHKNDLRLEVNGRTSSLDWHQERPNDLWIGHHEQPNQLVGKDPRFLEDAAAAFVRLPPGHQQGWADAFYNVIAEAYQWIAAGGRAAEKPARTATFYEGHRSILLIEAMLRSHQTGGHWQTPRAG
jgi:predicted dehydrogenase